MRFHSHQVAERGAESLTMGGVGNGLGWPGPDQNDGAALGHESRGPAVGQALPTDAQGDPGPVPFIHWLPGGSESEETVIQNVCLWSENTLTDAKSSLAEGSQFLQSWPSIRSGDRAPNSSGCARCQEASEELPACGDNNGL